MWGNLWGDKKKFVHVASICLLCLVFQVRFGFSTSQDIQVKLISVNLFITEKLFQNNRLKCAVKDGSFTISGSQVVAIKKGRKLFHAMCQLPAIIEF